MKEIQTFLKKSVLIIKNKNKKIDKNNFIKLALSPIVKLIKIIETVRIKIIGLENFRFMKNAKINKLKNDKNHQQLIHPQKKTSYSSWHFSRKPKNIKTNYKFKNYIKRNYKKNKRPIK